MRRFSHDTTVLLSDLLYLVFSRHSVALFKVFEIDNCTQMDIHVVMDQHFLSVIQARDYGV